MWRPKFNSIYTGPWPHDSSEGVGLKVSGRVTDEAAFVAFVMDFGCHPKAAARILQRMAEQGHDKLTVQSSLDFDAIARGLAALGVMLEIIEPQPNWHQRFDDGEWPKAFVPPHMRTTELRG